MKRRARERTLCAVGVLLCMLLAFRYALALDPNLDVSQYAHTAWQIRDGFAKGVINTVAQTPDGYIWLGTELGLLRFDGVGAVPWQPPGGEQLPSKFITGLLASNDGTLWISTYKGLASLDGSKLMQYPEVAGAFTGLFLEDREHTVWVGTWEASKARLCAIRNGRVKCYGAGTFGNFVNPLYEDHKGSLWVTSATGLWRWAPGSPERYPFRGGVTQVIAVAEDDSGILLLATNDGLRRLVAGRMENYSPPGITGHFVSNRFLRSRNGSLWIGTSQGLLHLHRGRANRFSAVDGLSGDYVEKIFEDGEGDVWVATQDGLFVA